MDVGHNFVRHTEKKKCRWWMFPASLGVVGLLVIVVVVLTRSSKPPPSELDATPSQKSNGSIGEVDFFDSSKEEEKEKEKEGKKKEGPVKKNTTVSGQNNSKKNSSTNLNKTTSSSCPDIPSNQRFVMFWQSEVGGCEKIPDGVTHVIWGFSLVGNGDSVASTQLQTSTTSLQACVKLLHKRCIKSLISIGGATNIENMKTISNPQQFALSALNIIKLYDLDGIDIDDETVGNEFDADRVIKYMEALHRVLKTNGNNYLLTFDGLAFETDDTRCKNPALAMYIRCFPKSIMPYVDWVNVMAYNLDIDSTVAHNLYETATKDILFHWIQAVGDKTKLVIGVCAGLGCAYGPGPSSDVIVSWTKFSLGYGGMMIYAGSGDINHNFSESKRIITHMQ